MFGTRPEVIKLAPVLRGLQQFRTALQTITVNSGQHRELLDPFLQLLKIAPDFDLGVMRSRQSPSEVCARVLAGLEEIVRSQRPELILVQGDTTTALAGALAGFHNRIPVGHVEAGLRSGDAANPFPEEMNRRLISRLATWHFAATENNRDSLLAEGVAEAAIAVTGNPVVDSLHYILERSEASPRVKELRGRVEGQKLLILTTHRRESFGATLCENLRALRRFIEAHGDTALVFAVHPNPQVVAAAHEVLSGQARIHLIEPLGYADFIHLLRHAWLIISDSGGVCEEAPTLGKPLFILRNCTERQEAIDAGVAQLVGDTPGRLADMLEKVYGDPGWLDSVRRIRNPFGDGASGPRIAELVHAMLCPARPLAGAAR